MPTKISWCDEVWNPVTGCSKVSEGCSNCYAAAMTKRFWGERKFSDVRCHQDRLMDPLRWKKPRTIFVNSMSDLFHRDVPIWFIDSFLEVVSICQHHTFVILTKRPERIDDCLYGHHDLDDEPRVLGGGDYLKNVWLGVSIEDQATADERLPHLTKLAAAGWNTFVSAEPLLGPIDIRDKLRFRFEGEFEHNQHWPIKCVIIGGESGPGARPCNIDWIRNLSRQCFASGVRCYIKQLGTAYAKENGEKLYYSQNMAASNPAKWPDDLKSFRELPWKLRK